MNAPILEELFYDLETTVSESTNGTPMTTVAITTIIRTGFGLSLLREVIPTRARMVSMSCGSVRYDTDPLSMRTLLRKLSPEPFHCFSQAHTKDVGDFELTENSLNETAILLCMDTIPVTPKTNLFGSDPAEKGFNHVQRPSNNHPRSEVARSRAR